MLSTLFAVISYFIIGGSFSGFFEGLYSLFTTDLPHKFLDNIILLLFSPGILFLPSFLLGLFFFIYSIPFCKGKILIIEPSKILNELKKDKIDEREAKRNATIVFFLLTSILIFLVSFRVVSFILNKKFVNLLLASLLGGFLVVFLSFVLSSFIYNPIKKGFEFLFHKLGKIRVVGINLGTTPALISILIFIFYLLFSMIVLFCRPFKELFGFKFFYSISIFLIFSFLAFIFFKRLKNIMKFFFPVLFINFILSLFIYPENTTVKSIAITRSFLTLNTINLISKMSDFDRDGYSSFLAEGDCAPFNPKIYPGAVDLPQNGIDEDCFEGDLKMIKIKRKEYYNVPSKFRRDDYNVIFLSVDALRQDRLGIENYKRQLTPNLDNLVKESVYFRFSHTQGPGTIGAMPCVLTGLYLPKIKFEEKGIPKKIKKENVLISEILKSTGYYTGAVLGHHYFENWGMEQGFDEYDNSLSKINHPEASISPQQSEKAISFVKRNMDKKFFLWVHYYDPHTEYVPHKDFKYFGDEKPELYDGEVYYTDHYIGKFLDFLRKSPIYEKTIIVFFSDHGDGFWEHDLINHGMHLFWEMIRVPISFRIPQMQHRIINHPSGLIDIVPTTLNLLGIKTNFQFDGESLVLQIFEEKEDFERKIFFWTDWPTLKIGFCDKKWKFIWDLRHNIYWLYDLNIDPFEKHNLADKIGAKVSEFKGNILEHITETSLPSYHPELLLRVHTKEPSMKEKLYVEFFDNIEVRGFDLNGDIKEGELIKLKLIATTKSSTQKNYKGRFILSLYDDKGNNTLNLQDEHSPIEGFFPTNKWEKNNFYELRFEVRLPKKLPRWQRGEFAFQFLDDTKTPLPFINKETGNEENKLRIKGEVGRFNFYSK